MYSVSYTAVSWRLDSKNTCTSNTSLCRSDTILLHCTLFRARICKPFKEPRNQLPAWWAGTTTLFVVQARHLHRQVESNPRNRFLVSLNVYKYGLRVLSFFCSSWNWDTPPHQQASVPPPHSGRGGALACWWGGGGVPIPTREHTLSYSIYILR